MWVSHARARRYAKEIVPAFSAYAYFRIGTGFAKWLSTAIYRVRLGGFEEADASRCDGGVRHQPPLEHGLCACHRSYVAKLGAQLRRGRMGARNGAAEPHPRHGQLFRAPG